MAAVGADAVAGVSGVQHARNATNMSGAALLAPQKVSTAYLTSSHFSLEQDPCITGSCRYSVFTKDYVPWDVDVKPKPVIPPLNVGVLGEDARFFNQRQSETKAQYDFTPGDRQQLPDAYSKLQATNFKMHTDAAKIPRHISTQHDDYTPKPFDGDLTALRDATKRHQQTSCVPQGDVDKADKPLSDYADRYRGHDAGHFGATRAHNRHQAGPATILGDGRSHSYTTSHTTDYTGPVQPMGSMMVPNRLGSNVAMGDAEKEAEKMTIHQVSYPAYDIEQCRKNITPIINLMRSNIVQGDDRRKWNDYSTTFNDSYRPSWELAEPYRRVSKPNLTGFPLGDSDPYRNGERANLTSNRLDFTRKPLGGRAEAAKKKKSEVMIGDPAQAADFYRTTHGDTFTAPTLTEPAPSATFASPQNIIPTDYLTTEAGTTDGTTYHRDFVPPNQEKLRLDEKVLARMRESHIRPQLDAFFASTEHGDQYVPKPIDKVVFDPGRLQRSSVPLGTLQQAEFPASGPAPLCVPARPTPPPATCGCPG